MTAAQSSLTVPGEAAAGHGFAALAESGKVTVPLGKTSWSLCFGALIDRFRLGWMTTAPAGAFGRSRPCKDSPTTQNRIYP